MSRLIDADELKHVIHCAYSDDLEILEKIDNQLTAFDVDEVIQQLETLIEDKCSESGDDWYTAECLNEAVEIVKGGGVE